MPAVAVGIGKKEYQRQGSYLKKLFKKFIKTNTKLSLHWPRLDRAGRKLLQVISELNGNSKGDLGLRHIGVLNNLSKKKKKKCIVHPA